MTPCSFVENISVLKKPATSIFRIVVRLEVAPPRVLMGHHVTLLYNLGIFNPTHPDPNNGGNKFL
jgi:hypothetical protein